ncbi:hypothetical protein L9F63_018663, partial [Diploptera punctata]
IQRSHVLYTSHVLPVNVTRVKHTIGKKTGHPGCLLSRSPHTSEPCFYDFTKAKMET